jgi:hypothetical protein
MYSNKSEINNHINLKEIKINNLINHIINTDFTLEQSNITADAYTMYQLEDSKDTYEEKKYKIATVKFNMIKRVFDGSIQSIDDCNRYYIYDYRILYNYCLKDETF